MAAVKDLFLDLGGAGGSSDGQPRLVRGILDSSSWVWPTPYHADKLNINLRALARNPDATSSEPYDYVSLASCAVSFKIWDSTGSTVLASQTTWTTGANTNILTAQVDLYTAAMISAMVGVAVKSKLSTILEIVLTFTDGVYTYRDNDFQIGKSLNVSGSGVAVPTERIPLWSEINAQFVKFYDNDPGKTVTFKSLDGTHTITLGVLNDGSAQNDIV